MNVCQTDSDCRRSTLCMMTNSDANPINTSDVKALQVDMDYCNREANYHSPACHGDHR